MTKYTYHSPVERGHAAPGFVYELHFVEVSAPSGKWVPVKGREPNWDEGYQYRLSDKIPSLSGEELDRLIVAGERAVAEKHRRARDEGAIQQAVSRLQDVFGASTPDDEVLKQILRDFKEMSHD